MVSREVDVVVFNGEKYRRYPKSGNHAERSYHVPGIEARKRGLGRLHQEVWKAAHGPIPDGYAVHHKNGDTTDNRLSNLECLSISLHAALHGRNLTEEQIRARRDHCARIRPKTKEWHRSEIGRRWHSKHAIAVFNGLGSVERTCEVCGRVFSSKGNLGRPRFCGNNCKSAFRRRSRVDDVERSCLRCGGRFQTNVYAPAKYCGAVCRKQAYRTRKAMRV